MPISSLIKTANILWDKSRVVSVFDNLSRFRWQCDVILLRSSCLRDLIELKYYPGPIRRLLIDSFRLNHIECSNTSQPNSAITVLQKAGQVIGMRIDRVKNFASVVETPKKSPGGNHPKTSILAFNNPVNSKGN